VFIPFPVLDDSSDEDDRELEKCPDHEHSGERHVEPVGLLDDGTEVFIPFPVLDDSSDEDNRELQKCAQSGLVGDEAAAPLEGRAEERQVEPVGYLDDGTEVFIPFPVLDDSEDEGDAQPDRTDAASLPKGGEANTINPAQEVMHDTHPCKCDVAWSGEEDYAEVTEFKHMEENGFAILKKALTLEQVEKMRELLSAELQVAIEQETLPPGDPAGSFAKIHNRECRHDLRLKLEKHVESALQHCVNNHRDVYKKLLPPNAPLVELGVITSHPGAQSQIIHADVDFCGTARKIFTTFVALQAVDESMGPTEIWPGTHTAYFCEFYKEKMLGPVDPYYQENKPERMTIEAGDAVLLDTRVMHRGGDNCSQADRMLFHFSWETTAEEDPPQGFTYNLRPELRGKHRLSEFISEPRG